MDPEAGRTMELAALGRPFSLGMLYDCRQDSLIPGITLWDHNDLDKDIREKPKPNTDFEIVASETTEGKSSVLQVGASLKASFLGGLVEVEGSAKYLNDQKKSKNQARVTLTYKTTTKFQELSMSHLARGNVKYSYVFDQGIATHVVTGILYGAQAFFVFDCEVSEQENHQDIEGNLKVMIKKIPSLSIEGDGSLKMDDKDMANVQKFSCKFHGDFSLKKEPLTFQDAIEVYQSLPKLLGANGENVVPVKVWLLPLTVLDSSATKLVRQISVSLVQEAQRVLEDFSELEMRCNDALMSTTAQQFPQIGKKLKTFKEMCCGSKLEFQQIMAKKLPSIRGGGEEEAVLTEILKNRRSSPFNSNYLHEWIDFKERELCILKSFTNMMKNTKIIPSQNDLQKEILRSEIAVCFVFTSLGCAEPYLSVLSVYLRGTPKPGDPQDVQTFDIEKEQWYLSSKVSDEMRRKSKLFSGFAEANKDNENIEFLTVGLTDEKQKGSSIYVYKDGFPVNENFEPPSKPETVTVSDRNHDSVTLKISPPTFGVENITSYSVEYCVSGDDGWQEQTAAISGEVTVSDLWPNTEYMVRCRAVTSVGVGPVNVVSGSIKTLPCSPPGKPQVEPTSSEISVSWDKPAELGQDVHILSYMVEYAKTDSVMKNKHLEWNQMMSRAEKAVISGLQSETEYLIRVRCDCGVAGRSKDSITVNVCTATFKHLAELLMHTSERINSGSPSVYKLPLKEEHMGLHGCRRYKFGEESTRQNQTIMLLGATGSGKSTLIDGIINYIVGVEWKDNFRFKLIDEDQSKSQAHSQTSEVTVYKLYHQEGFQIDYSLTIVDTPGFGDTRGIERDRMIVEQLRNLFSADLGVSEIHAVCFVAQASLARLRPTQKYVFDSILSIFGKDVAENIRILVTFADCQRPPFLEAIKASGVPCPKTNDGLPVHFKFNNSALFAHNKPSETDGISEDDEDENFDKMFWNMGTQSMKRFFVALNCIEPKSLTLTKQVLRERKQLENSVENLQEQVKLGLARLEEIKETSEILKEHEAEISRNKDFEFEVTVTKPVQVDISGTGCYITNCQQCHFTCHESCGIANAAEKYGCSAKGSDGRCTVCPGKCYWNVHFNQKYKWKYIEEKEKRTVKELEEKYLKATEDKPGIQALVDKLEAEDDHVQAEVVELMETSAKCLNRLKEIALKPNPLYTPEYIDMLIEGEKSEAKPGWNQRVKALTAMREKAEYMAKVEKGEKLLRRQDSQQGVSKPAKTGPGENPEKAQEMEAMTAGPQGETAGAQGEGEKSEAKPGWNQRVKALTAMKVKAEYMAKVEKGEKLLHRQESQRGQN